MIRFHVKNYRRIQGATDASPHRHWRQFFSVFNLGISVVSQMQLSMKNYYTVIISGSNIFFENYNDTDPVVGFVARRIILAESEEMATATAKRDILVNWNNSFNADRRMGLPSLHLEWVTPFTGWRLPKIKHDYYWFTDEGQKLTLLEQARKPMKRWIWW